MMKSIVWISLGALALAGCGDALSTANLQDMPHETARATQQSAALDAFRKATSQGSMRTRFEEYKERVRAGGRGVSFSDPKASLVGWVRKTTRDDGSSTSREDSTFTLAVLGGGQAPGGVTVQDRLFIALATTSVVEGQAATAKVSGGKATNADNLGKDLFGNMNPIGEGIGAPAFRDKPFDQVARAVFRNAINSSDRIKRAVDKAAEDVGNGLPRDRVLPEDVFNAVELLEVRNTSMEGRVIEKAYVAIVPLRGRTVGSGQDHTNSFGMFISVAEAPENRQRFGFVHGFGRMSDGKFTEVFQ